MSAVTSLGDNVFVFRCHSRRIEVYNAVTFTLKRCLTVPGFGSHSQSLSLAACASNDCVYASDFDNSIVGLHRAQLPRGGTMKWTKWSVARNPVCLSVNNAQNVVVISEGDRMLQEFTTYRNVQLQSESESSWHAVQLSNGQFVVSYSGSLQLVDVTGTPLRSYSGMDSKFVHLAVDKAERVFVVDENYNKLFIADQSLTSVHEITVPVDGGLYDPYRLWHDKSRDRLYIGEWYGGRVIVVDFAAAAADLTLRSAFIVVRPGFKVNERT